MKWNRHTYSDRDFTFIGLSLTIFLGVSAYIGCSMLHVGIADPLVAALILGIGVRLGLPLSNSLERSLQMTWTLCVPVGIFFYGMKNLNFMNYTQVDPKFMILAVAVISVYFGVIFLLGKRLRQKREIMCLTATGSAICGGSAIAIAAPAVNGKADDVSISLLAVVVASLVGLFVGLPFLATTFNLVNETYGILSGSVLQMTGFVKSAASSPPFLLETALPEDVLAQALSVKTFRYLGLLVAIPLFASFVRGKFYIPWVLWLFVGAGLLGTLICIRMPMFYSQSLVRFLNPAYRISWSIAMAALGLNADAKLLLSDEGAKALFVAVCGMFAAILTFFVGYTLIT